MHEKTLLKQKKQKEKYKCLAVMIVFLFCGLLYSHRFYTDGLDMGTPIQAEEFAKPTGMPAKQEKINLNTASAEELQKLSGIGEQRAADIIAYREENGAFAKIQEMMNISGIGEKIFEEIKDEITVGE